MKKIPDTQENLNICMKGNCSSCPTYSGKEGEGLFCARGPSQIEVEKKGCNCPECPVWLEKGLSRMYYCSK